MRTILGLILTVSCLIAGAAAREAAAQIELDRIRSRIDGRIVTQSDIRRAGRLRLVDATTSDEVILRALEDRLLILQELERAAPLEPPNDEALQARRSAWVSALGDERRAAAVLREEGMTEAELDGWLRDDLRIGAYLRRQFGMLGDADRERAVREWLGRLRQRAGLRE